MPNDPAPETPSGPENSADDASQPPVLLSEVPDQQRGAALHQVVLQQGPAGTILRLWAWLGWIGFTICGLIVVSLLLTLGDYFDTTGGIYEKYHSGAEFGSDKVAIISVSGLIMQGDGFVKQQIDRVRDDDNVRAIVLRVDSPGGTVTGSDYIFHHLTRLRREKKIPLVVSMGSIATSGGYYVSMAVGDQEKSIYAEPTTTTGSIGVVIPHYDVSGLLERFNVKDDSLATHPRKQMLSMTQPMTEDDRMLLESYLDESFTRFKEIVKKGRPDFRENPGELDELATGEIFSAQRALANGLVDELGFIEEAIDRAIELAGLDNEQTRVIEFEQQVGLFDFSGVALSRQQDAAGVAMLLDMTTPRAYYIATTLPPLAATYSALRNR